MTGQGPSFNHTFHHDLYLSVQSETLAEQQPTDSTRVVTYGNIDSRDQNINQFKFYILYVCWNIVNGKCTIHLPRIGDVKLIQFDHMKNVNRTL